MSSPRATSDHSLNNAGAPQSLHGPNTDHESAPNSLSVMDGAYLATSDNSHDGQITLATAYSFQLPRFS
jgi:hypothetical protein